MLFNRDCGCERPVMAPAMSPMMNPMMGQCCNPCGNPCCDPCAVVTEPTITKCVQKEFMHEVKHVCPIHTHVVNKNVYTHTYVPQYSCSEENQMIDVGCGSCSNF
jgi:hypothetical protein